MGCAFVRDKEGKAEEGESTKRLVARRIAKGRTAAPEFPATHERLAANQCFRKLKDPISAHYSTGKLIAKDAEGTLIHSTFLTTGKHCVLKAIRKKSERLQQRVSLCTDIELLRSFDHPHILKIYEAYEDDSCFYVASEPFYGPLKDWVKHCRVGEELAATIMHQVFGALNYCLQRGIGHGKLSPSTIMMCGYPGSLYPKVKITGFRELDAVPDDLDCPNACTRFQALETSAGLHEKSDVWSCGAIVLSLLFPHLLEADISQRPLATLESVSGQLDPGFLSLLAEVLDPVPGNRPSPAECRQRLWITARTRASPERADALNPYLFTLRKVSKHNSMQDAVLRFILARMVNEREAEKLIELFTQLDVDGNGVIGGKELLQGFLRILPEQKALIATKRVLDAASNNGTITYSAFVIACMGEKRLLTQPNLRGAFSCFDPENRGAVFAEDLSSVLFASDSADKVKKARAMLRLADNTQSAQIDFREFRAIMSNVNPA